MSHQKFVEDTNRELIEKGYTIKQIEDYWSCFLKELEGSNE
jgi:hypothetical protein